ncbi:50S ribosomal protein L28 [bacterium]|nr:50S ribosomal protein L28 [bacterium]
MARKCDICKKQPRTAQRRSHSNKATRRWQHLNLQTKRINGKKIKICARCLKTLKRKVLIKV